MKTHIRSDVERYKEQAARLRQFLAAGGIELKNTHALEAIAKIHGSPDWHTLSEAKGGDEASEATPPDFAYAVVTPYCGYSTVSLAPSRELALRAFLIEARLLIDLLGADREVIFVGQDVDAFMPLLSLMIDGEIAVSLQHPSIVDGMNIARDKDGEVVLVPAKMNDLCGLQNTESYYAAGVALTEAFAARPASEEVPRASAAASSLPAELLDLDINGCVVELAAESQQLKGATPLDIDPKELLKAVDKIHLTYSTVASIGQEP